MKSSMVAFLSFLTLSSGMVSAEQVKPQITLLHSSTTSSETGEAFSYPAGTPKLSLAQVIVPKGGQLPMHTHPAPLIVHVMSGELTSERLSGEIAVYKAGDTFVEAPNSPHKVTNTGSTPTIFYAFFAGFNGMGKLTIPVN
ncbi:MAG: cupin domain-containing protein [Candidatus Puniceispirillum sp.]|nr:cupin domain-containing protein [Candidatus Puniceispirillum sp.]MBL6775070.1 cupin domain-containing protein [Candidatus Puniceispirillum sp.]